MGAAHLLDAELVVHDLHKGRQAVGGAARVGDHVLQMSRSQSAVVMGSALKWGQQGVGDGGQGMMCTMVLES